MSMIDVIKTIPEPTLHKIPDAISEPTHESTAFINEVMTYINTKPTGIVDARGKLNEMLSMPMAPQQLAFVKKKLSKLSEEWLFSRATFTQDKLCSHYKVESGDQFRNIGRKFRPKTGLINIFT